MSGCEIQGKGLVPTEGLGVAKSLTVTSVPGGVDSKSSTIVTAPNVAAAFVAISEISPVLYLAATILLQQFSGAALIGMCILTPRRYFGFAVPAASALIAAAIRIAAFPAMLLEVRATPPSDLRSYASANWEIRSAN